ncbi:hypothetical protein [Kitasatospora cinereorecta]|uniref:Lipoprotein n=1 Tax=Kitasatospora cinereorecta TaxID=285560 RepID=A0ABW0VKG2_9ACTN
MRRRANAVRPGVIGVGGVALSMLLTACSSGGATGSADRLGTPGASVPGGSAITPSSGSSATGAAPTDGAEGAFGRIVLRSYQAWWDAQTDAFGRSDSDGSQLRELSSGQALSETLATLDELHRTKLVMTGAPRNSPVVRALDLKADPPTAVVEDCLDVSAWHQADSVSKTVKDPAQRYSRYVVTVGLRKADSRWLIVSYQREVGRTC